MRYQGGKARLARVLAQSIATVAPDTSRVWEPFCGGLSVTAELAKRWPVVATDAHAPLIALYNGYKNGWRPPQSLTESDYSAAKALPDTDPLKAFVGVGCSFGGKWFGGFARSAKRRNYCEEAARCLARKMRDCEEVRFAARTFDSRPARRAKGLTIYCDPPYQGTTGYGHVEPFDRERFWARCKAWSAAGAQVFVSEFSNPRGFDVVWSRDRTISLGGEGIRRTELLVRVN